MQLKKLSVKNLGCFDEEVYSIDFTGETLIAGPNNSGKSMFLSGVNIIRYLIVGGFGWSTDLYNLVNFDAAVHAHENNRTINIVMTLFEGSNQFIYDASFDKEKFGLQVNGKEYSRTAENIRLHNDLMRRIWFFRPNRSPVPYSSTVQPTAGTLQPLRPDGSNVINYLLERWTDRDKGWDIVESWLRKIDPDMTELKTPIRGNLTSLETMFGNIPVNVSLQGSGFQSAAAIIAAVVFSPENSTIIIEEPEVFLHPNSQEIIVDMINDAVNNQKKQVIFSTHSCNILLPFYRDIGINGRKREAQHIRADLDRFSMWTFKKTSGKVLIDHYPLKTKTFQHFKEDFKYIWG